MANLLIALMFASCLSVNSQGSKITPSLYSPPRISERDKKLVQVAAEVEIEIRRRLSTFKGFVAEVRPSFLWYRHCDELGQALERVSVGEIKRLMIFMPPRSGKSEETSRLFPAYYLYHHPDHHFGITSYAAELAYGLNRDARDNYLATGNTLKESAEGMVEWHTSQDGRAWAAGVGGPITGKGGDVLLVDDPFKNEEEAYSQAARDKVWEWWQHTFYTRLHPNGAIILICTRWHEDDLAGRLLAEERGTDHPEKWTILNFEAVKEEVSQKFPETCVVVPDWRSVGEVLCPERYPIEAVLHTKSKVGSRAWRALYQQNPIAEGGNLWKLAWFKSFDDSIQGVRFFNDGLDWDLAYGDEKDEENAACAYIRTKLGTDGNIYVFDMNFKWFEFPNQVSWMKSFTIPHYVENKGPGKSVVQALNKEMVFAQEVKVKGGDKVARTILATPMAEGGRVYVHKAIWDKLFYDERQGILGFPAKPFKDVNDAFVQAINRLWPFAEAQKAKAEPARETVEQMMQPQYMEEAVFEKHRQRVAHQRVNPDSI